MRIIPADVRIIAATNKNLRELITCGEFREDLFYALSVISITIPPLRERKEDIPRMVDAYATYFGDMYSKPVYFTKQIHDCISEYRWPGNSRQLKHYCQKLVLTTPSRNISEAFARNELESLARQTGSAVMPAEAEYVNNEAALIIAALEHNRGNKTKAAEELGISKTTLWRKIQKYGITEAYR